MSKKFIKLDTEKVSKLSPEELAKYVAELSADHDIVLSEKEKAEHDYVKASGDIAEAKKKIADLENEISEYKTINAEMASALAENNISMSSGRIVVKHKGKSYQVNAKHVQLDGVRHDIDAITGKSPESIALRDKLIARKSGILKEVE